ncbi:MAG: cobalt-precorrin 5A hydrolase [Deltaproteobacteria bacterium]|nr:cobalt-precorrin 5A hydrolase [Deltaproteobacteria bacterium]
MKEYHIAIWTLNDMGLRTALRLRNEPGVKTIFTPDLLKKSNNNPVITGYDNLADSITSAFNKYTAHVFIMATGIVIRIISRLIKDKTIDPAIVVMDEMGKNIISVLSGHMGGANRLTLQLAAILGGNPVITTATDINNITAVDTIAMETGSVIENKNMIKTVSGAMLKNEPVAIICDLELYERYYGSADYRPDHFHKFIDLNPHDYSAICIISEKQFRIPPDIMPKTLVIRPPNIVLGIGCNSNIRKEEISYTVNMILSQKGISPFSITGVATIDKKKDEPGLTAYCESINRKLDYYSAEDLNKVGYRGMSPPSPEARKHVGAMGVAEPAALLSAGKGAELIVNKIKSGNMTLAIARKKME